ncbi:MAG TPA: AraC family transcriptional regulator [Mucilaginibacter sp.]|jgi:AraC-like DNA-binding protein|nr:AraC family transcriptional regulator [Mucilaginibacter sp.]
MEYIKILDSRNKITSHYNWKSSPETATNLTMRFVFGGSEICSIGRRRLSLQHDSFIVLNKGTQFTANSETDTFVNVFSLSLDDDFLNEFNDVLAPKDKIFGGKYDDENLLQSELIETIYPLKPEMKHAIVLLKEYLDNGGDDEDMLNEYFCKCLLNYFRIYKEEILNKARKLNFLHYSTRIEILRRLNLAKEYLYANYNRNVNLDSLADHACLSVNHLLRTFKLAYNQSPHQFLIQLRLQRAQLLLTKTEYPVYEIVNMVGFKCTSSFIRLFRTRYKTTPLKYRNVLAA